MDALTILIIAIVLSPIAIVSLVWLLCKCFGERERGIYERYEQSSRNNNADLLDS